MTAWLLKRCKYCGGTVVNTKLNGAQRCIECNETYKTPEEVYLYKNKCKIHQVKFYHLNFTDNCPLCFKNSKSIIGINEREVVKKVLKKR